MNKLQKFGGFAAIFEAITYIGAFIYFGALLEYPSTNDVAAKLAFLKQNHFGLAMSNLILYVLFGLALAVLVLATHQKVVSKQASLMKLASLFGYIWVGLVIAAGMIGNISLELVIRIAETDQTMARTIWLATDAVVEGIGGGNEIVGGIWVLLLSIAALKADELSKGVSYLGLFVGLAGISTVYPATLLTEIFGLSQIVWFVYLGIVLIKQSAVDKDIAAAQQQATLKS